MHATVTSKGQVTLPKALREKLHVAPGDRIEFVLGDDETVQLVVQHASIERLKGMLPKPGTPVSLEEMDQAIENGARKL